MRLPDTAHTSQPWRIHQLTSDFRLEDVWALRTPGGPDDFPRLVQWVASGDNPSRSPAYRAVRVEVLAKALGVTKGGFYGHFADRHALLEEMLDSWERMSTDEALERVERHGGDVRAKIRLAGALTFSRELMPVDLAIRDWARRDQRVADRLRRVDNRRMDYLRLMFGAICANQDEVEARSMLAFSLAIGQHYIAADHGARSHADVLDLAARWLLAP